MRRWKFLLAVAIFGLAASEASAAQKLALVIGNDAYENLDNLQKAVADAQSYAALLEGQGYQVTLRTDANRAAMDAAIAGFIENIAPGDSAVFAYSGHGWSDGTQNYMVGVDAPATGTQELLTRISIPLRNGATGILDDMDRRGAAVKIAIIDACRDNPFKPSAQGRGVGLTRGLTRVEPPEGTFLVFSAAPGQSALDGLGDNDPNPNSIFTRVFVPLVASGLSLQSAIKETQGRVVALARTLGEEQRPTYVDEMLGDTCLGDCRQIALIGVDAAPNAPPAVPPAPVDRDMTLWQAVQNSTNPADFQAYLAQFPDGLFAALANNRLALLTPPAAPPPTPAAPQLALIFQGKAQIEESYTINLDTGEVGGATADLWYHAISASEGYLEPRGEARLAIKGGAACADTILTADPVPVPKLGPGAVLCVQTGAGHLAEVNIEDIAQNNGIHAVVMNFSVYARGGAPAAGLAIPLPAGNADVNQCDILAASPTNPDNAPGVTGVATIGDGAKAAIDACERATADYPGVRRFYYQLGRAYAGMMALDQSYAAYRKAADMGSAEAMRYVGFFFEKGGAGLTQSYSEALNWYRRAADGGYALAMNDIGNYYVAGTGVPQDYAAAREWYGKAAAAGDYFALNNLGALYQNGQGGARDYDQAFQLYQQSAKLGNPQGMYNLAVAYELGLGTSRDYAAARGFFQQSADAGYVQALTDLGLLYERGYGVRQSYEAAREWYEKAVAAGDAQGMHNLANLLDDGQGGARNPQRAAQLFIEALSHGLAFTFDQFRDNSGGYSVEVRRAIQAYLIQGGYLAGTADGVFGGQTRAALTAYQEALAKG